MPLTLALTLTLELFAGAVAADATPPLYVPPSQPRLLVVISVDQLSADLFDAYRPQFTAGLQRLSSGALFRNGYQGHATTETCPGHATILTGDHPARNGIIANAWIDQSIGRPDKTIYCAEDEQVAGSTSSRPAVSARHLLVPTLGELMKQRWPASRTVAVAGKDRSAVMLSGQRPDQRWYWTGNSFHTDLVGAPLAAVVAKVNAAAAAGVARARGPLDPTPFCAAKAVPVAVAGGKSVGAGRLARAAGDRAGFEASPELDGDTLALAAGLVDELQLGRRGAPDVLAIGLSATDHVGHAYGTEGEEMCLQLTELDREIGDFLRVLDSRSVDYAVVLTADHGGQDLPERRRLSGVPGATRVNPALDARAIGAPLARQLGVAPPGVLGGRSGDIYLDARLAPATRQRLLGLALQAYRANPQVEAAFSAAELAGTPLAATTPDRWTMVERARAGYFPGRSGDLVVLLKKDVTDIADPAKGSVATHGSPWDYDRRVPILFWRPWFNARTIDRPVDTVDIMPTLAAMIGLPIAQGSIDGRCLAEVQSGCASGGSSPAR
ncbi:MAG: alkaline phosphatase family protein [Sphingomicrobium sp.]